MAMGEGRTNMGQLALRPYGGRLLPSTLRDFLSIGFRRRRLLAYSFFGILLGGGFAALVLPRQYQAQIKILVKRERFDPVVTPDANSALPQFPAGVTEAEINSEVELLRGRDLLEKVVLACGLDQDKSAWAGLRWFGRMKATRPEEQAKRVPLAVRSLERKLRVERLPKTNLISLTYQSSDQAMAARVLNTLAGFYLEKHLTVHRPPGAYDFFQQQKQEYEKELADAEAQLVEFSRKEGVASAQVEKDVTLQRLTEFEASLKQTNAAISESQQRVKVLEAQARSTPARLTTQVRTADNPQLLGQLKATLLNLELKRTELLSKYDPTYRPVQEVNEQIAQTQESIAAAQAARLREETTDLDKTHEWVRGELAKAQSDLAGLQARALVTQQTVQTYRDRVQSLEKQEISQQDLMRKAKGKEASYLLYLRKEEEARISDALDRRRIVNVAIAEAATVPALPVQSRFMFALLGLVLAVVLSLATVFVTEFFDPSFRSAREVEAYLEVPVLAALPESE